MAAAIAGGVTSLACPPDTDPPLDEPGLVEMLKHRARSLNQARVYPIGALTVQLAGQPLDRDGRAPRSRVRRVLASRRPAGRHRAPVARDAVRRRRSAIRSWLRAERSAHRPHRRRARRRGRDAPRPRRHSRARGDDRAVDDPRAGARHAACACTCAGSRAAESVAMVRAAKQRGPARHVRRRRSTTCTCATSTSAGSTPNARLVPPLRTHARSRGAARGRRGRHDRRRVLRSRAGRRRRQAGAVRRSGARRDRPRAPAAADAQVGERGRRRRCRARSREDHERSPRSSSGSAGGRPRRRQRRRPLRLRSAARGGRSSARRCASQGKNTPFLGLGGAGAGPLYARRGTGRPRNRSRVRVLLHGGCA